MKRMKRLMQTLLIGAILSAQAILVSCAPTTTPTPTSIPAPATPGPVSVPISNLPRPISQDVAWVKVVEAAKKEGVVTAYTYTFSGDVGTAVAKAFWDKFGIRLEVVSGVGSILTERIKSEHAAGKQIADTLDTSASILSQARDAGLVQNLADLPVLQEKGVWQVDPTRDAEASIVTLSYQLMAPFINTSLVKVGEEPQSYLDLLGPRWKGKITVGSPDTTPNLIYVYALRQKLGLSDDYFARLGRQEPRQVANVRELYRSVVIGEAALILSAGSGSISPFVKEGAPIRILDMKEGIPVILSPSLSLIKKGPHPNAARVFINWILSPEGQYVLSQARSSMSVRREVADFTPKAASLSPQKPVIVDSAGENETGRIMAQGDLARLMGLSKK